METNNTTTTNQEDIIPKNLLAILACPVCHNSLELVHYHHGNNGLKCQTCNKIYPIRDGIPVMLKDQAIPAE